MSVQTNLDFLAAYHPNWGTCRNERASFGDVSGFVESLGGRRGINRMIERQVNDLLKSRRRVRDYILRQVTLFLIVAAWLKEQDTQMTLF